MDKMAVVAGLGCVGRDHVYFDIREIQGPGWQRMGLVIVGVVRILSGVRLMWIMRS